MIQGNGSKGKCNLVVRERKIEFFSNDTQAIHFLRCLVSPESSCLIILLNRSSDTNYAVISDIQKYVWL